MKKGPHYIVFPLDPSKPPLEQLNDINTILAKPQYPFAQLAPFLEKYSDQIDNSKFAQKLEDPYTEFFDFEIVVTDIIGQNNLEDLFDHPTDPLIILKNCIKEVSPSIGDILQDSFPLNAEAIINSMDPDYRSSFAAIASLLHENAANNSLIYWLGQALVQPAWHGNESAQSKKIKYAGLFERHHHGHGRYWAIVSPSNTFTLYKDTDCSVPVLTIPSVHHIDKSRTGNSIRIWSQPNTLAERLVLLPNDTSTRLIWTNSESPAAISLPLYGPIMPHDIIEEFHIALLQSDTLVLRTILNYEILPMKNANALMRDLFNIFADKNLVHRYISTVCAIEFSNSSLQENTVLRSTSHLTNLFKTYYDKYGRRFFDNIIKPIIQIIEETGDIGLKTPTPEIADDVLALLNQVIDKFLQGGPFLTPQMRHMAFVLKSVTATVLRSRHAVFNALSSFLCLRFTNAVITDPQAFDPTMPTPVNLSAINIPFATLLQIPFNLQPLTDRYSSIFSISEKIITRYEEIYNFVLDSANIEEEKGIPYEKPSKEEVERGVINILKEIAPNKDKFMRRYNELYQSESEKSAATFAMSQFIYQLFSK